MGEDNPHSTDRWRRMINRRNGRLDRGLEDRVLLVPDKHPSSGAVIEAYLRAYDKRLMSKVEIKSERTRKLKVPIKPVDLFWKIEGVEMDHSTPSHQSLVYRETCSKDT